LKTSDGICGFFEEGGVEAIMQAFQAGACPHLHTLALPIPYYGSYYSSWEGAEMMNDWPDPEQTEIELKAIAQAMEARRNLGILGLKKLQDRWLTFGSVEVRARLLRVLLPSVEELPKVEDWRGGHPPCGWQLEFAAVFDEVGAPELKRF
jgi:hypothetical protein